MKKFLKRSLIVVSIVLLLIALICLWNIDRKGWKDSKVHEIYESWFGDDDASNTDDVVVNNPVSADDELAETSSNSDTTDDELDESLSNADATDEENDVVEVFQITLCDYLRNAQNNRYGVLNGTYIDDTQKIEFIDEEELIGKYVIFVISNQKFSTRVEGKNFKIYAREAACTDLEIEICEEHPDCISNYALQDGHKVAILIDADFVESLEKVACRWQNADGDDVYGVKLCEHEVEKENKAEEKKSEEKKSEEKKSEEKKSEEKKSEEKKSEEKKSEEKKSEEKKSAEKKSEEKKSEEKKSEEKKSEEKESEEKKSEEKKSEEKKTPDSESEIDPVLPPVKEDEDDVNPKDSPQEDPIEESADPDLQKKLDEDEGEFWTTDNEPEYDPNHSTQDSEESDTTVADEDLALPTIASTNASKDAETTTVSAHSSKDETEDATVPVLIAIEATTENGVEPVLAVEDSVSFEIVEETVVDDLQQNLDFSEDFGEW